MSGRDADRKGKTHRMMKEESPQGAKKKSTKEGGLVSKGEHEGKSTQKGPIKKGGPPKQRKKKNLSCDGTHNGTTVLGTKTAGKK